MTGQNIQTPTEMYDSINQPVSYAVVYGLVPELRRLVIPQSNEKIDLGLLREEEREIKETFRESWFD